MVATSPGSSKDLLDGADGGPGQGEVITHLIDVATGWSGVKDADDKPLAYSEANLRALCKIPGIAGLAFRTYLAEVGAKEKN